MAEAQQDNWPFLDPRNTITITSTRIVWENAPILYASRDDSTGWYFWDGIDPDEKDIAVVALSLVVSRDPSLYQLADLPVEWCAWRDTPTENWSIGPKVTE